MNSSKKKIIYGAGFQGKCAFCLFGSDSVYCFADKNKAGGTLFEKEIISLRELCPLQHEYEIIICIAGFFSAIDDLTENGVTDYTVWDAVGDLRIIHTRASAGIHPLTLAVVDEVSQVDFIAHPEKVLDYFSSQRASYIPQSTSVIKKIDRINKGIHENGVYGFYEALRDYAGVSVECYEAPAVAHGVNYKIYPYTLQWPAFVIMGQRYIQTIHNDFHDVLCFNVGPHLNYAASFYGEQEFLEYKNGLGKNLLVFPVHTIPGVYFDYDHEEFIRFIMREGEAFDTITICSYWNDYNSEIIQSLSRCGCKIVTAGLTYEPSFCKRLKTIITAADAVVTNGIGSHIAFCLGLGKPIKVCRSKVNAAMDYYSEESLGNIELDLDDKYLKPFCYEGDYRITQEQLDTLEDSAGFSKLRTREEMAAIFEISKRVIRGADYKWSRCANSIRRTYKELQNASTDAQRLQFKLIQEALPLDYDDYLKKLGV